VRQPNDEEKKEKREKRQEKRIRRSLGENLP